MSCKKCSQFQAAELTTFYRWKNADIEVRGCEEHLKEIFRVLTEYQTNEEE